MTSNAAIQNEINNIMQRVRVNIHKQNPNTKKIIAEFEASGLSEYFPAWMLRPGEKAWQTLSEIMREAVNAGGKRETVGGWTSYGDADYTTYKTDPSKLYTLLHSEPTDDSSPIVQYLRSVKWTR